MKREVWIINGIPGVGKTTTARRLAQRIARSAHIEGDYVHDMVVGGLVQPGELPEHEANAQLDLCRRNQILLVRSFVDAGFTAVIDYVYVLPGFIDDFHRSLPGIDLHLVTLAPGPDIALHRDAHRPEKTVAAKWLFLEPMIKEHLSTFGLWVDNAAMTVDAVVDYMLLNQHRARI
jgi:chloramphenicol 3-O-phosphotransferase